jgi:hypothetical protein
MSRYGQVGTPVSKAPPTEQPLLPYGMPGFDGAKPVDYGIKIPDYEGDVSSQAGDIERADSLAAASAIKDAAKSRVNASKASYKPWSYNPYSIIGNGDQPPDNEPYIVSEPDYEGSDNKPPISDYEKMVAEKKKQAMTTPIGRATRFALKNNPLALGYRGQKYMEDQAGRFGRWLTTPTQ